MDSFIKKLVTVSLCLGLTTACFAQKVCHKHHASQKHQKSSHVLSSILGGHYAHAYNGYDLFINGSSINTDAHLLLIDKTNNAKNSLLISGAIQALLTYQINPVHNSHLGLTFLEFQSYATLNHWAHFFLDTLVDPNNIKAFYPRYFMTIGNYNVSNIYLSVGKMYVPFGLFNTSVINVIPEVSEQLGGIKANTAVLGWGQWQSNLSAQAYIYQSNVKINHHLRYEGGFNVVKKISVKHQTVTAGLSFVTNMFDSQMLSVPFVDQYQLTHNVQAIDVRTLINLPKNIMFSLEWMNALRSVAMNSHYVQPYGMHLELVRRSNYKNKPISYAVGYDNTEQTSLFNLPNYRIYGEFSITPIKHSVITFEVNDDKYKNNLTYQNKSIISAFVLLGYYF